MESLPIRLSILDQSIIPKGSTAADAINNTIETARFADKAGFYRFWVSEHHNAGMIAGSAPELLMVRLASETKSIRIGSGGIMLPNHSALKVAENFRLLETMYPGRIDLGMGRAPGGDRITASLLNPSNTFSEESYLKQLEHLQGFFRDEVGTQHGRLLAIPQSAGIPQQWVLSSSGGSADIAARFGMGLALARFINGFAGREIVQRYEANFQASDQLATPEALVAITVLCADTDEKANQLRKVADYTLLQFEQGNFSQMYRYEDIADYQFTDPERQRIKMNSGRIISGAPENVKRQILGLATSLGVNEVLMSAMTQSQQDRIHSFQLLAEVFELSKNKDLSLPRVAIR